MHDWPLTDMWNMPWHALQRTLASDVARKLTQKEPSTARAAQPEEMTSWLVRALVEHPPTTRFAQ